MYKYTSRVNVLLIFADCPFTCTHDRVLASIDEKKKTEEKEEVKAAPIYKLVSEFLYVVILLKVARCCI